MAVVSLQKQPGAVERAGSRRASPPNSGGRKSTNRLPRRWLQSGRATSTGACSSSGPATLAPRRACTGRAGWALQLRGEILLQIRCRCSEAQLPLQFVIAAGERARGIEDAPTSAYAAVVLNWTLAGCTAAMRVFSRLDVGPINKYTSALS